MLTGLFFLGGLTAFFYLCWWIYDNEKHPDGLLPQRGLLAMATPDDLTKEATETRTPAWKRKPTQGEASPSPAPPRIPRYRRRR